MATFKDLANKSIIDEEGSIDPVSIFYNLNKSTSSQVKDLFPIQKEALVEWVKANDSGVTSNLISMDTGTGKTFVGLLIAESMRRKSKGKIFYVCPTNNLIGQTASKAKEYGIPASTYNSNGWTEEENFLANKQICITNYHSLYHQNSIFKNFDIKGVIFDDAHLSIEIIDQQYTLSIKLPENKEEYDFIINLLEATELRSTIQSITIGQAKISQLVPVNVWKTICEEIKVKLQKTKFAEKSFQWGYVSRYFNKALCFVSEYQIDISLIYPSTENHFLYGKGINKVFLSATIPNRGDLIRVFGEDIHRINLDAKDYRPERLFVFSKLIKPSEDSNQFSREDIATLINKTLVLTPSSKVQELYSGKANIRIVSKSTEIDEALRVFTNQSDGVLVLASRYDGIDLPDAVCRSLVIDGMPFVGSLKYRFFSEYFHNHNQSFLRSLIASKLIQAFGRTVRGHSDYSVIFIVGLALNRWLLDKDNQKFLRADVIDDLELGMRFSSEIDDLPSLRELVNQMVQQHSDWKSYVKENRKVKDGSNDIDLSKETEDIDLAKIERSIIQNYHNDMYNNTIELIERNQERINMYSQPILGLYLSIASFCAEMEGNHDKAYDYSSRAFAIRSLFGKPSAYNGVILDNQAQRIINSKPLPISFIWEKEKTKSYGNVIEEDFKTLGKYLGFDASRPEEEKDGTLDVLWVNHEEQLALGFELKCDKENKVLNKTEIGQCHDHFQWMETKYPSYEKSLYVIGDLDSYHALASPGSLKWSNLGSVINITEKLRSAYAIRKSNPSALPLFLKENNLLLKDLFPETFIKDLEPRQM